MANCSYSKQVWQLVQNGSGQTDLLCQGITTNIKHWWNKLLETADNVDTIRRNQIITYTAWNIRKEHYRRIFYKAKSPQQIVDAAMQDVALLSQTVANEVTE